MWPGVWEEQQEPRVSLPIPKLWESKPHSGWWKLGHRLLLLLVNGCDQCARQKVHLPPSTKGPTFSPKVNWETKFVLQCGDVQEPECGDSLVGGGGMRLAYCAIMRPEKHAIGCTRCAAHHSCTHSQHEWPVPANRAGNPRKDISIRPRNLRHIMHSRANSTK